MAGTGSRVSQMGQHQLTHWITEGGWIPGQLAEDPKASQSWFWSALGWGRGAGLVPICRVGRLQGCSGPGAGVCPPLGEVGASG